MRSFSIVFIFSIIVITALSANAEGRNVTANVAHAVIYPMSFEGKGLVPTMLHSLIALVPVADRVNLILKTGMATSLAAFQPAPQFQFGVANRFSDGFALGMTGIYRYVPHWSGAPSDAHLVGASVGPTVLLPSKIALVFPVAVAHNVTTKQSSLSVAFEFIFQLPL